MSSEGYETRECWDLKYEDEQFAADGCYKGKYCHHEHCFEDVTVCICDKPECNDWSSNVGLNWKLSLYLNIKFSGQYYNTSSHHIRQWYPVL